MLVLSIILPNLSVFAQDAPLPAAPPEEKWQMRSMYHELDMLRLKAKREHGVNVDMRRALGFCIEKTARFEDCRAETDYLEHQLEERITRAQISETEALRQKALSEKGDSNNSKGQTNIINQQQESITIINRTRYERSHETPTPRATEIPKFKLSPGFKPQNRFQAGDGFR